MKFSAAAFQSCVLAPWLFATHASAQGGSFGWLPGYVNSFGSCNVTSERLSNYVACLAIGIQANSVRFSITQNNTSISFGTGLYAAPFTLSNFGATSFPGLPLNGNSSWTTSEMPYNCTLACRAHGMKYAMMINLECNCSPYITYALYYNTPSITIDRPDVVYFPDASGQNSSCIQGGYMGYFGCYGDNSQTDCGSNLTAGGFTYGASDYPVGSMGATTFVDTSFASDSTLVLATQVISYAYLACFNLSSSTTSFMPLGFNNNFTTPSQCYTFCAGANMPYAGISYQGGSLPIRCTCGTEFAPGSYQYLPDLGQCNRDCGNGSTTTCIGGQNCCGNGIYYAVYRNPNLLGCYEPPIPGTSLTGTATYPVACFSTVCPLSTASVGSYVNPNPVAVYTPTATPANQHQWIVPGYSSYTYIGCYNLNILTKISSTTSLVMQPSICAAFCMTGGTGGTATKYFSLNLNSNANLEQDVVCTCGNAIGAYQPQLPFGNCNFACLNAPDQTTLCGGRFNVTGNNGGNTWYGTVIGVAVYGPFSALSTIHRTIYPTSTYSCRSSSSISTLQTPSSSSSFLTCWTPTPSSSSTIVSSSSLSSSLFISTASSSISQSTSQSSTLLSIQSFTQSSSLSSSSFVSTTSSSISQSTSQSSSPLSIQSSTQSSTGPLSSSIASPWFAPTSIPYIVPGDANYAVSGVYSNQDGDLLNSTPGIWVASVEVCLAYCDVGFGNYAYAGMDYLGACHCGSGLNLQSGSPGDESATSPPTPPQIGPCVGNPNEYCGAGMYQLVYARRSSPLTSGNILNPWQAPGDGNYTFNSIWSDTANRSPFITAYGAGQVIFSALGLLDLDIQNCLSTCENLNPQWQYAGLENGNQCWCGNGLNSAANTNLTGTPGASAANVSCAGNPYELCGGVSVMAVYSLATYTSLSSVGSSTIAPTTSSASLSSSLILTSSTATATASISPGDSYYQFSNCYDSGTNCTAYHELTEYWDGGNQIDVDTCLQYCEAGAPQHLPPYAALNISYQYAILEFHGDDDADWCFCTNFFPDYISGPVSASKCNVPCIGNSSEFCGGYNPDNSTWSQDGGPNFADVYSLIVPLVISSTIFSTTIQSSNLASASTFMNAVISGLVSPTADLPSSSFLTESGTTSTIAPPFGPGSSTTISSSQMTISAIPSSPNTVAATPSSSVQSSSEILTSSGTSSLLKMVFEQSSSIQVSPTISSSFQTMAAPLSSSSQFSSQIVSSTIASSFSTLAAAPGLSVQPSSQSESSTIESTTPSSSPMPSSHTDSSSNIAEAPSSSVQASLDQNPSSSAMNADSLSTSISSAQIESSIDLAAVSSSSAQPFSIQVTSSSAVGAAPLLTKSSSTELESSSNVGAAPSSSVQFDSSQSIGSNPVGAALSSTTLSSIPVTSSSNLGEVSNSLPQSSTTVSPVQIISANNVLASSISSAPSSTPVLAGQIISSSNVPGASGSSALQSTPVSSSQLTGTTSSSDFTPSTQMSAALSSNSISSSQLDSSSNVAPSSSQVSAISSTQILSTQLTTPTSIAAVSSPSAVILSSQLSTVSSSSISSDETNSVTIIEDSVSGTRFSSTLPPTGVITSSTYLQSSAGSSTIASTSGQAAPVSNTNTSSNGQQSSSTASVAVMMSAGTTGPASPFPSSSSSPSVTDIVFQVMTINGSVNKRQDSILYLGSGSAYSGPSCSEPLAFTLSNGTLSANGRFVSTNPDVSNQAFTINPTPSSIITTFGLQNGTLFWSHPSFFGGLARFCRMSNGKIDILFTEDPDNPNPSLCVPVSLQAVSASTCPNSASTITITTTLARQTATYSREPHVCPAIPPGFLFSTSAAGALCVPTTISWYPDCTPQPSTS